MLLHKSHKPTCGGDKATCVRRSLWCVQFIELVICGKRVGIFFRFKSVLLLFERFWEGPDVFKCDDGKRARWGIIFSLSRLVDPEQAVMLLKLLCCDLGHRCDVCSTYVVLPCILLAEEELDTRVI